MIERFQRPSDENNDDPPDQPDCVCHDAPEAIAAHPQVPPLSGLKKISPQLVGPFKVIESVGRLAYCLNTVVTNRHHLGCRFWDRPCHPFHSVCMSPIRQSHRFRSAPLHPAVHRTARNMILVDQAGYANTHAIQRGRLLILPREFMYFDVCHWRRLPSCHFMYPYCIHRHSGDRIVCLTWRLESCSGVFAVAAFAYMLLPWPAVRLFRPSVACYHCSVPYMNGHTSGRNYPSLLPCTYCTMHNSIIATIATDRRRHLLRQELCRDYL